MNGNFGIVQSGIGLAFPPVGDIENFAIPANSSRLASVPWTPPISGHYCIQFEYVWTNGSGVVMGAQGPKRSQLNLNAYGGTPGGNREKGILAKTRNALKFVSKFAKGLNPFAKAQKKIVMGGIEVALDTADQIDEALGGDPPRQDLNLIAEAEPVLLPTVVAEAQRTAAMATALTELQDALAWANAHGEAAIIPYDRYGGATAASSMEWASAQITALNDHKSTDGGLSFDRCRRARCLPCGMACGGSRRRNRLARSISRPIRATLRASGFTNEEIAEYRALGLSDAEIEAIRQGYLETDPDAGNVSYLQNIEGLAASFRELAGVILYPPTFGFQISGGAGLVAAGVETPPVVPATNNLARV